MNVMKQKLGKIGNSVVMLFFIVITAFPIYFALISSVKNDKSILLTPFALPNEILIENFTRAIETGNIGRSFVNSLLVTAITIFITATVSTLASYILARFSFKSKNFFYLLFIAGMMIPIQSIIIPLSFNFGNWGLRNNYIVLILLFCAFQIPMSVFIITGFLKSIPSEIEEAALIDGCSTGQMFRKIVVPLAMPAVSSASIFTFVGVWNNLLFPLIFIDRKDMQLMSVGLQSFFAERSSDYGGVMAAIVISMLPPLIVYILMQEKVVQGLTAGAVKG